MRKCKDDSRVKAKEHGIDSTALCNNIQNGPHPDKVTKDGYGMTAFGSENKKIEIINRN